MTVYQSEKDLTRIWQLTSLDFRAILKKIAIKGALYVIFNPFQIIKPQTFVLSVAAGFYVVHFKNG